MTLNEVDLKLKEINPDFNIVPNPNNELASLHWKEHCVYVSMPKENIPEFRTVAYCDPYGRPHRGLREILEMATGINERLKDPEYVSELLRKD
jgi:hypothetical protein